MLVHEIILADFKFGDFSQIRQIKNLAKVSRCSVAGTYKNCGPQAIPGPRTYVQRIRKGIVGFTYHMSLKLCALQLSEAQTYRGMATQSLHDATIHVPDSPTILKHRSVVSQI